MVQGRGSYQALPDGGLHLQEMQLAVLVGETICYRPGSLGACVDKFHRSEIQHQVPQTMPVGHRKAGSRLRRHKHRRTRSFRASRRHDILRPLHVVPQVVSTVPNAGHATSPGNKRAGNPVWITGDTASTLTRNTSIERPEAYFAGQIPTVLPLARRADHAETLNYRIGWGAMLAVV